MPRTPSYSLDSIAIDGFRGIHALQLEGLGLVNILVGPNNCGKTSVLEAISILCNPLDPFEWLSMVRRRDFGGLDETRIQSLRWCFSQSGQLADADFAFEGVCELRCSGAHPVRRLQTKYRDVIAEPGIQRAVDTPHHKDGPSNDLDVFEPRRGAEIEQLLEVAPQQDHATLFDLGSSAEKAVIQIWEDERQIRPSRKTKLFLPTETLTPYSYQINPLQVRHQSLIKLKGNRAAVLELVREFDSDIEDLDVASIRGVRPAIYLRHRRLGPAPLSVFGDALRRAVLLAGTLPTLKKGGVLLIDELETGIHISALQRVFSWLIAAAKRLSVQIVATTHSLEAVDAILASQIDDPSSLVAFHLPTLGQKPVKRFAGDILDNLRFQRGIDIR